MYTGEIIKLNNTKGERGMLKRLFCTLLSVACVMCGIDHTVLAGKSDYSVGIFKASDYASEAASLKTALEADGYTVDYIASYSASSELSAHSCIILMDAINSSAADALNSYAKGGGDLVILGSSLFNAFNNKDVKLPIYNGSGYSPQMYTGASTVKTAEGQSLITANMTLSGDYSGTNAICYPFYQKSEYIPILEAIDEDGRRCGYAAGVMTNYDGDYKNGNWLVYGICEKSFYSSELFKASVISVLKKFSDGSMQEEYTTDKMKTKNRQELNAYMANTPLPEGAPLRIGEDGKTFIDANDKPVYLVGANTFGPGGYYNYIGDTSADTFSVSDVEDWFKRASDAGINCFRLWYAPTDAKGSAVIKDMARKYGIYLILQLNVNRPSTDTELSNIQSISQAYGTEDMVIGYDLLNEPDHAFVVSRFMEEDGTVKEINAAKDFAYILEDDNNKGIYDWQLTNNYTEANYPYLNEVQRKNMAMWNVLARVVCTNNSNMWDYSCRNIEFSVASEYQNVISVFNQCIADWVNNSRTELHKNDADALVTIGWANPTIMYEGNAECDFLNMHEYLEPENIGFTENKLALFDRLSKRFNNKPIMIGEYGTNSGHTLESGEFYNYDEAEMLNVMEYLYGYANGYAGASMWRLTEQAPHYTRYDDEKIGFLDLNPDLASRLYLERFGMYYYDGQGYSKKPTAMVMGFFKNYSKTHTLGDGSIELFKDSNQIGTGFKYESDGFKVISASKYYSPELSYESNGVPIVALDYTSGDLKVMSTKDITLTLNISKLIGTAGADVTVGGQYKSIRTGGQNMTISLYAGEEIRITSSASESYKWFKNADIQ